jgi:predicted DNA-binding transcriptional regulator AlpA
MSKQKPKRAAPKPAAAIAPPALLLEAEVLGRCRPVISSRAQLWKLEQAGRFPPRKKYGFRRIAWPAREIDEWIAIGAEAWAERHATAAAA